ncbi:mucin-2-like [Selaginella moellendorffii]|uniref:mucin-2-like n=1 Tax=Selaginella moellendorffii TaxID=88036 RepID=UPI000D1C57DF|nr:mucin-2-like [Selaginella moellendorffii]|eukprot:XP_024542616.1 mucin-2-like [Selaginella moellendorffii]
MKRKGFIAEGDVTLLLKRYDSSTILSLLYEVSKQAGGRVSWDEIVKDSNTGIKNAREYQALWRHLAYRKELDPDGEELPLEDDDSDLEFDVEAFPSVSSEASADAASYVNALMGFSTDIAFANADSTALGLTSIYPGFSSAQAAGLDSYRTKRKPWTAQEDEELVSGVEKYGEGNWAAIVKSVFKHERTATQLAQRWALIKRRRETTAPPPAIAAPARQGPGQQCEQGLKKPKVLSELCEQNGIPGLPVHPVVPPPTSLPKQLQSTQVRTEKASVTMPRKLTSPTPAVCRTSLPSPSTTPAKPKPTALVTTNAQKLSVVTNQQVTCVSSVQVSPPPSVSQSPAVKPSNLARTNSMPNRALLGPDPMVQAAAVAAGARIAPASAAASFMKAKNVVHIRPPTILSSPSTPKPNMKNSSGGRASPVVHYIRTGSGAPPPILPSLSAKRSTKAASAAKNSTASKLNLKNTMSRLAVNSSSRDQALEASKKRKIIVARENNGTLNSHVSSWYEVLEETSGGADTKSSPPATMAVVDVDSDTDEVTVGMGAMVCTSSNESFSQSAFGGAVTPNGASPLSQSSGGLSE